MRIRIKKIISFEIYTTSRTQYYGEEIEIWVDKIRWATKMCSDYYIEDRGQSRLYFDKKLD